MCDVVDGRCELADQYPDSFYHNKPDLYYQIHGVLIDLHSKSKKIKENSPYYGYRIGYIRKKAAKKIIAISEIMIKNPNANEALCKQPEEPSE